MYPYSMIKVILMINIAKDIMMGIGDCFVNHVVTG